MSVCNICIDKRFVIFRISRILIYVLIFLFLFGYSIVLMIVMIGNVGSKGSFCLLFWEMSW